MKKELKRYFILILMIVLTVISVVVFPTPDVKADDENDTLRLKWKDMLTGGSTFDTADSDIAARISSITSTAQQWWDSMDKSTGRTYLWNDCTSLSTQSDPIATSYDRLRNMALAYATRGSTLQNNATLKNDIITGLDWLYANYYNETKSEYDNWYDWEIAIPLRLNDITVLMDDDLTGTQISNYMNAIAHFTPNPDYTGANRVWTCVVTIVRGIISKNSNTISSGRNGLSNAFTYVTSGDGFYTDGSFIQHTKHPYTGGYGLSELEMMSMALYVLYGSSYDVTDANVQNVYQWVIDSFEPVIYKGALMDMIRGREMSRYYSQDHIAGHRAIKAIYKLAETANAADAASIKSMIKYWLQQDTFKNFYSNQPIETIVKVKTLMNDSGITPMNEPVFNKIFPNMARAVHVRPGYGFGISMFSSRIYNYESINSENKKGYHMGDGMTYLYNSDLGQYSGDFWATVNPYRLPGTTVRYNTTVAQSTASINNWVGGSNILDTYGTAGMDMATPGSTLTAKKSWFMFDDEIVALGAGINCTNSEAIETIVENRKLNASGDNAFTVNGTVKSTSLGWTENMTGVNWAHLAGDVSGSDIGYYFSEGATLTALREARTGKWSTINSYSKAKEAGNPDHTNNFLTMYFNHGVQPVNATYSYVILPGKTSSQVSSYASNPDISVLSNNTNVQAVKETGLNIIEANFWTDTSQTVDMITCDKKASVITKENPGSDLEVAVSDPTQANTGTITVEINRSALGIISIDSKVTVNQLSPTIILTINTNGTKGATIKAKFSLSTPSTPASQGVFYDNFEEGLGNWAIQYGTPGTSTLQAKSGGYSFVVNEDYDAIYHSMGADINGFVEMWFYDNAAVTTMEAVGNVSDNITHAIIGVYNPISTSKYAYRIGSSWYVSTVDRGTGWHKFTWDYTSGTDLKMYIDDTLINTTTAITSFNVIKIGDFWGANTGTAYFDDIKVSLINDNFNHGDLSGWTLETSGGNITIEDVPDANNKSVILNDISASALVGITRSFMPQTGILNVEYQFMQSFLNNWFKMRFDNDTTIEAILIYVQDGNILCRSSNTTYTLQSYSANTWYNIKVVMDIAANTYDVYVNDVLKQSGLTFYNSVNSINKIWFRTGTSDIGSTYIDNVVIN